MRFPRGLRAGSSWLGDDQGLAPLAAFHVAIAFWTLATPLFGNHTVLPSGQRVTNGFEGLAFYDRPENGGNGDGLIDARDAIWSRLQLWIDWNHNGVSEPEELYSLDDFLISSISLHFETINRSDGYGNVFRLKAPCQMGSRTRFGYDVYFSAKPQKRPN